MLDGLQIWFGHSGEQKNLVTIGIWTPSHQAHSPVTTVTMILWFHKHHTEPTNTHCRQNKYLQKMLKKVVQIVIPHLKYVL